MISAIKNLFFRKNLMRLFAEPVSNDAIEKVLLDFKKLLAEPVSSDAIENVLLESKPLSDNTRMNLQMSLETKYTEGEVWVNGVETGVMLSPYINSSFNLNDKRRYAHGPHTNLFISPEELDSYIGETPSSRIRFSVDNRCSGCIDEFAGYSAADMGPHTRYVTNLQGEILRGTNFSKFTFMGITGYLENNSINTPQTPEWLKKSRAYNFYIWFKICDEDLPIFFKSPVALSAMQRFIQQ